MTVRYVAKDNTRAGGAPTVKTYDVLVDGERLGQVQQRRGGWWRAYALTETGAWKMTGSFHRTRKEAAASITERGQQ